MPQTPSISTLVRQSPRQPPPHLRCVGPTRPLGLSLSPSPSPHRHRIISVTFPPVSSKCSVTSEPKAAQRPNVLSVCHDTNRALSRDRPPSSTRSLVPSPSCKPAGGSIPGRKGVEETPGPSYQEQKAGRCSPPNTYIGSAANNRLHGCHTVRCHPSALIKYIAFINAHPVRGFSKKRSPLAMAIFRLYVLSLYFTCTYTSLWRTISLPWDRNKYMSSRMTLLLLLSPSPCHASHYYRLVTLEIEVSNVVSVPIKSMLAVMVAWSPRVQDVHCHLPP